MFPKLQLYIMKNCYLKVSEILDSMRATRHHKEILFDYSLHNQTLENVQSAKYLGITITDNMDWGQHVSEIFSKATKTLGFLRRNLGLHLGVLRILYTKLQDLP